MGQKYSFFDLKTECSTKNTTLDCSLSWEPSNLTNLTHIGGTKYGDFEANGDLAGLGTLLSFTIPTGVALLVSLGMTFGQLAHRSTKDKQRVEAARMKRAKKYIPSPHSRHGRRRNVQLGLTDPKAESNASELAYDILETILIAMSDFQTIWGLALVFYFNIIGKCSVSMYHFNVGLSLILVACANNILTLVMIRGFWRTPLSSLARVLGCAGLLSYIGIVLFIMKDLNNSIGLPETLPPKERDHSLILLTAGCLLDEEPLGKFRSLSGNSTEQKARAAVIGKLEKKTTGIDVVPPTREAILWGLLVCAFGLVVVYRLIILLAQCCRHSSRKQYNPLHIDPPGWFSFIRAMVCMLIVSLVGIISGLLLSEAWNLREWVFNSGWLKNDEYLGNEEAHPKTFGQVAALCAMGGFLVVGFDRVTWRGGR